MQASAYSPNLVARVVVAVSLCPGDCQHLHCLQVLTTSWHASRMLWGRPAALKVFCICLVLACHQRICNFRNSLILAAGDPFLSICKLDPIDHFVQSPGSSGGVSRSLECSLPTGSEEEVAEPGAAPAGAEVSSTAGGAGKQECWNLSGALLFCVLAALWC